MGGRKFLTWLLLAALLVGQLGFSQVHVRGYFRKDGTYVQPHYRSSPDGNFSNNWSTYGNVNPYTGAAGTKRTPSNDYGADVHVDGYTRRNGTYVAPHYRSAPDGDPWNNWTTRGNVNPHTSEPGSRRVEVPEIELPSWAVPTESFESVPVRGYTRRDGAYVAPHFRSAPDDDPWTNWSTRGNVNPHTGERGSKPVHDTDVDQPRRSSPADSDGSEHVRGLTWRDSEYATPLSRSSRVEESRSVSLKMNPATRAPELKPMQVPSAIPVTPRVSRTSATIVPSESVVDTRARLREPPTTPQVVPTPRSSTTIEPPRRKTAPGTVRIGLQSGRREPEILEVTIKPAGRGQLRFEWEEQGRRTWFVAKDDVGAGEVVRGYRASNSPANEMPRLSDRFPACR